MSYRTLPSVALLALLTSELSAQFAAGVDLYSNTDPWSHGIADVDGDGAEDLLVRVGEVLTWKANDGNGVFGPGSPLHTFNAAGDRYTMADMDGNASMDLVYHDELAARFRWRPNDGTGSFGSEADLFPFPLNALTNFTCEDIVADARPEIIVQTTDSIFWWSDATGMAAADSIALPVPFQNAVALGMRSADIDGNGRMDIVTMHQNNRINVALNNGDSGLDWTTALIGVFYPPPGFDQFQVIDVDGDEDQDLIEFWDDRRWGVNELNEGGPLPFNFRLGDGIPPVQRSIAAHFGCGDAVAVLSFHSDEQWRWSAYDPVLGDFGAPLLLSGIADGSESVAFIDGDARPDLLIRHGDVLSWYRNELPETAAEPLPPIELDTICSTAELPLPGPGTWDGFGVVDNTYFAVIVGLGDHELFYSETSLTGCIASTTGSITVVQESVEPIALGTFCASGDPYNLPGPGTWSGPGVVDGVFTPGLAGDGDHELLHTVETSLGCIVNVLEPVSVISSPIITPMSGAIDRCTTGVIEFSAVPEGGVWGAAADEFGMLDTDALDRPFVGSATYTYTDIGGGSCTSGTLIELWPLVYPGVGPNGPYCSSDGPATFQIGGPMPGGVFVEDVDFLEVEMITISLAEVTFDPSIGPGDYTFNTSVSAPMACGQMLEVTIHVDEAIGDIELMAFDTLCAATVNYPLGEGPIPGATWSGVGVSDGLFTPEGPLEDEFTAFALTYSAVVGACEAEAQTVIRVGDPIIDTTDFVTLYCSDGEPVQFTAKPLGGTWTPPVGPTGVFDPASITATLPANYMVLYTYVDPGGQPCASALGPITVNDLPEPSVEFDVLCSNAPPVVLSDQGTPQGGMYYINDAVEPVTELDPAELTDASYDLTYAYTDPNTGCSNSASTTFTVEVCVGSEEHEANTLRVFPNPTSNGAVRITGQQPGDLFLYDATGRVLWQRRVISEAPIMIDDLATGVYRLVSRTADERRTVGVVVE